MNLLIETKYYNKDNSPCICKDTGFHALQFEYTQKSRDPVLERYYGTDGTPCKANQGSYEYHYDNNKRMILIDN